MSVDRRVGGVGGRGGSSRGSNEPPLQVNDGGLNTQAVTLHALSRCVSLCMNVASQTGKLLLRLKIPVILDLNTIK